MNLIKYPLYKFVKYILNSDFVREQLWFSARDLFCQDYNIQKGSVPLHDIPERYRKKREHNITDRDQKGPVFITARFRAGSTFLWQLFRNIEGVTAYYEPFNENRWFLQTAEKIKTDPSHIGVKDYCEEYKGQESLDRWFRDDWTKRYLYMSERHYDPDMYNYVKQMITNASGRPVLQFNRIDFRLKWLRVNFPNAKIIHFFRDCREQWMSMQNDGGPVPCDYVISETSVFDLYYLLTWAQDLRHIFPFLNPVDAKHPYALHYYLWRLSYSFGKHYAGYSLAYEDLITDFNGSCESLFSFLGIKGANLTALSKINNGKVKFRWREYASDSWFEKIEAECERVLENFFTA